MKNIFISFLLLVILPLSSTAQYKIDLRDKRPPTLINLELGNPGPKGKEIKVNNLYMEIGGTPQLPVMGEFHYSRMDHRYWRDALLKMKASGINIVSTYILWSLHEEFEGESCWNGNLNLRKFAKLCQELDLLLHIRIGPYCNAEIKQGGVPDWLVKDRRFHTRSNDPLYLEYVRKWYKDIYEQTSDLLYKDGGPIMAVQLENEYVTRGMVVSHLMNLKKIAIETGFDVPLYTMTHWMDSEYPKGEIIPYAGYYIETPWTATGKKELPISNFEYFSYNRISNNIGTDIIKIEGEVESLGGTESDSPYFTCEIGVGTTSFYNRRAIIPQEMAGENINLRLGCGVNLMGYYMYVGGSNPVGRKRTFQSSGPRISYDYQAPVREFGTLGEVMYETKKYNYFMNDFGSVLAPAVAYLPVSNQNTENLQWAVRVNENSGFLFCSNYLYKHDRKEYKNVQFTLQLQNETLQIPRQKIKVKNGAYFLWPFNQSLNKVMLKYSTTQPVCIQTEEKSTTYFFFQDDEIDAEYLFDQQNIRSIQVNNGTCKKEKDQYFIHKLIPGKDCVIDITKDNGEKIYLITLTEKESDEIWKLEVNRKDFVALTSSTLISDNDQVNVIGETPNQEVWVYEKNRFSLKRFTGESEKTKAIVTPLAPMAQSDLIAPAQGNRVQRTFNLITLSSVEKAYIRTKSGSSFTCLFNSQPVSFDPVADYRLAEITSLFKNGENTFEFILNQPERGIIAEVEILLQNGSRLIWPTNTTWTSDNSTQPVNILDTNSRPLKFAPEEQLALYEIRIPEIKAGEGEIRAYIAYMGDVGNAYIGSQLINDSFYNGSDWIISASRFQEKLYNNPLIIRIEGLKSADNEIYFEKTVHEAGCMNPQITNVSLRKEYRYSF